MSLKSEILILLFSLLTVRYGISTADGMSVNKAGWWTRHLMIWLGRDTALTVLYMCLWDNRSSDFLAIPLCYVISLNWSLHVIGYWLGDAMSSYQRFRVGGLTLAMGIGAALFILAGLYLSAVFMQNFYAAFGVGLLVGFIWAIAYRIAYRGYGVIR